MLARRLNLALFQTTERFLSTSTCLCRKKVVHPWDDRFPVFVEDVAPDKKGGSVEMMKALPEEIVAPTGLYHNVTKEFIPVPEMVPEFVVPDLTGFELKPYVSYKAKEITQGELTPQDIFNSVYAPDIEDDLKDGQLEIKDGQLIFKDGRVLNIPQLSSQKNSQ